MEQLKEDVMDATGVHIEEPDKKQDSSTLVTTKEVDVKLQKTVSLTDILPSFDEKQESDTHEKEPKPEKDIDVSLAEMNGSIMSQEKKHDEVKHADRENEDAKNTEKTKVKGAEKPIEDDKDQTDGDDKDMPKCIEEDTESAGDATVKDQQAEVLEEEEEGGTIPVPDSVRQCYYKFKSAWEACQEEINTSDNYEELVCQIAAGGDQLLPTCWRAVIEKMKECNHPESLNMVIDKNQKRAVRACKELREKQITPPSKDKARTTMAD